jgi:methylated-DNA-[protein]-cysteine S-methyltransferase
MQALSSGRLPDPSSGENRQNDYLNKAVRLLQAYFAGDRTFFDFPIDTRYYTTFQKAVWKATSTIPFGETRSYAWIARAIQNPKSVRAVGQALGANPLPIIIPCHRVVNSSGALGGFGGGLMMKKKLLALETSGRQLQRAAT